MQVATVVALTGFSVWNQMSYLPENWHPTTSSFGAPRWLDIIIRAVGAPLARTMGEKVAEQSHKTLEAFLGVVKYQRKQAIKQINGEIVDMGDASQPIAAAANEKRAGSVLASVQGAIVGLARAESSSPRRYPRRC